MLRLGLCCVFKKQPIRFRTTTKAYVSRLVDRAAQLDHLAKLIRTNIAALQAAIDYCAMTKIGGFRINSHFLPLMTHPDVGYSLNALPSYKEIMDGLAATKRGAKEAGIRLSFHPDQFVVLSSPREHVVQSALQELEAQALLAGYVGADVICIHGGGSYGSKPAALLRLQETIRSSSPRLQSLIALENDDRTYTPCDLLPVCEKLGIPLVYDVHHHRCLPDRLNIEEATAKAVASWKGREPLFHLSSPISGWHGPQPRRHSDYIDPSDFPSCWLTIPSLTVEVEAKAKELAIFKLQQWLALHHT